MSEIRENPLAEVRRKRIATILEERLFGMTNVPNKEKGHGQRATTSHSCVARRRQYECIGSHNGTDDEPC